MFLFSMQVSYLSCPNYLDCKFLICGAPCTSLGYKLIIIILKSRNKGNEIKIQFYYSCYMPLLCITLSLGLLKVIFLWLFMGKKKPHEQDKAELNSKCWRWNKYPLLRFSCFVLQEDTVLSSSLPF